DRVGALVPRDSLAGRVLLDEGGAAHVLRERPRRARERARRRALVGDPPGRDQHAAVRPGPSEDGLPAPAGAADLRARALRRGRPALLRAPRAGVAARVGSAEAPLGTEALSPGGRPRAPSSGLAGAAHFRAEAHGLAGQSLSAAAPGSTTDTAGKSLPAAARGSRTARPLR